MDVVGKKVVVVTVVKSEAGWRTVVAAVILETIVKIKTDQLSPGLIRDGF